MIVRKVLVFIAVSTFSFMLLVATAFASPQLSDADISFSVKGYYTQYSFTTNWTADKYIKADGTEVTQTGANYKLSDSISVTPGGTIFSYRNDTLGLYAFRYICFYDSQGNVVPGGYNDNSTNPQFFSVPDTASTARITYQSGIALASFKNYCRCVSAPFEVNINNYTYLWTELQGITIDEDGFVTIPYQVNSYTFFMLDFRFFDSTFQFSNMAFDIQTTYTGGYFSGTRLLTYGSGGLEIDSYYIDDQGNTHVDGSVGFTTSDNPYHFYGQIPYDRFSGFRVYVDTGGSVSTSMKVHLYNFELDGEGVAVQLAANSAIDDLNQIGDQLELSTPDVSQIYDNLNNIVVQINDSNFGAFDWFGPTDGIFITMCVTSFTFAALAYILFGKRG